MNVGKTRKPQKRVDVEYLSRFHIQSYGRDNRYPQNLMEITAASGTAELCLSRYAKFVEGFGFTDDVAEIVVNNDGQTADDLLRLVVLDLTRFGGFSLHVNYNILGEVSSVYHVPFEMCRLAEKDDNDNADRWEKVLSTDSRCRTLSIGINECPDVEKRKTDGHYDDNDYLNRFLHLMVPPEYLIEY